MAAAIRSVSKIEPGTGERALSSRVEGDVEMVAQVRVPTACVPAADRLAPWFAAGARPDRAAAWWGWCVRPLTISRATASGSSTQTPAAWMSLFAYVVMAVAAAIGLIWRLKLAHAAAAACAPVGASFTFLALVTGSIWGKPMCTVVWDAGTTSELIPLFLYFGYMAFRASFDDTQRADRASAILAIVGVVNVLIIHYSVEW